MSRLDPSGLRLSLYYASVFAVVGVLLPFWPLWLAARGLGPGEIGAVLSAPLWVKVISNPLIAQAVDRRGERRRPMIIISLGALAAYALFALAQGFLQLLAVSVLAGLFFAALNPLGENLTLLTAQARGLDYGRIRLWGSLAFIAASAGAGRLLAGRPDELVLGLVVAGLAIVVLACIALPDTPTPRAARRSAPLRRLLGQGTFLLFLAAASLIQASHAVYYGFATLHWRGLGLGAATIGWLWAEGVVAEIVLFAFSGAVVRKLGPARLIVLAGLAGVVRWSATGLGESLALLVLLQALHGFTFGAAHLGAMHFIARAVPPEFSASAQSLYSALGMGVVFGLAMLASGALYASLAGAAFHVMAAMAGLGAVLALILARRWRGGTLAASA